MMYLPLKSLRFMTERWSSVSDQKSALPSTNGGSVHQGILGLKNNSEKLESHISSGL